MSKYTVYELVVKKWMTKKATEDFTFMSDFNKDNPMPFIRMAGFILKRNARGTMYYMRCRGELFSAQEEHCMCCGRKITNEISQYFGMGPECGHHNYVNPFKNKEDLHKAVASYKENYLHKVIWEGWVPKSAIVKMEEINKAEPKPEQITFEI